MNFRRQPPQEPTVDMTSLIDVVFLLLIFFMIATQFKHKSSVKIALPQATLEQPVETAPMLEVFINAQGQYRLNENDLAQKTRKALLEAVQRFLDQQSPLKTTPTVVIYADGQAPHQAVITVLDVVQGLGMSNVRFVTQPLAR